MDKVQLSFSDVEKIVALNDELIIACQSALIKLRQVPIKDRNSSVVNNITYWENARSALRWASGQAKQRLKGVPHGR